MSFIWKFPGLEGCLAQLSVTNVWQCSRRLVGSKSTRNHMIEQTRKFESHVGFERSSNSVFRSGGARPPHQAILHVLQLLAVLEALASSMAAVDLPNPFVNFSPNEGSEDLLKSCRSVAPANPDMRDGLRSAEYHTSRKE
jgi:hypothetical protein